MAINLLESFKRLISGKTDTKTTPDVAVLSKVTALFGQLPNPDLVLKKQEKTFPYIVNSLVTMKYGVRYNRSKVV